MVGRQNEQTGMQIIDVEKTIPERHLLRKLNEMMSFDFIYDLLAPYYPSNGRPSVDPASMFKMLLVGYLYRSKSERRFVEEIQLNIVCHWFCGFELYEQVTSSTSAFVRPFLVALFNKRP